MTDLYNPLNSLREGHWFKLICGASFQHLPAVRNLTLAYTLAGADCIDVAADPAVIAAAQEALKVAGELAAEAEERGFDFQGLPWLMVSLNDGEDPHFRKAEFNPIECPTDCWRPCEQVCPAEAIAFNQHFSGVIDRLCYGCGRCIPICPSQLIFGRSYVLTPQAIAPLVLQSGVDALEIHTQLGRLEDFKRLWQAILPWSDRLKLIAVSCPDGEGLIEYLWSLYELMQPLSCALVWQTDGRPMSGDIGAGTTHAAVKLGQKVLAAGLPGYVQLAGGTNSHTVTKLRAGQLLKSPTTQHAATRKQPTGLSTPLRGSNRPDSYIAGVAYGSYARVLLSPILEQLERREGELESAIQGTPVRLESEPELLWQAVAIARSLVSQLKSSQPHSPVNP